MKAAIFFLFIVTIASCSPEKSKKSDNKNNNAVSVPVNPGNTARMPLLNYTPKPVWEVSDGFIPIDSIWTYSMIDYSGNLEYLNVFMCLQYNRNYAQIKFKNNILVIGNDTLHMYHEQKIIGFYMTDSSYEKGIHYLIINDSGDYSEEIDLISTDSTGKIIDAVCLMMRGGDGGDSYFTTLTQKGKFEYEILDFESHQNFNDSMNVIEETFSLSIKENGEFIEKRAGVKKDYLVIGEKNIMRFWDRINY